MPLIMLAASLAAPARDLLFASTPAMMPETCPVEPPAFTAFGVDDVAEKNKAMCHMPLLHRPQLHLPAPRCSGLRLPV